MDLWDVVKLIVRRWLVSVPLLLLTAAALVWTGSTVTPNYTAEGNILLLPATTEVTAGEGEEQAVNPWDTDSLTGAVIALLRNQGLAQQLAAEGYTGTWEAERDVQFWSVVNITVTAPTEGEAQATVERLAELVAQEVNSRQQGYGLTEGQLVGTVTLGAGENVEIARGNQMRALIVVFFAGAIVTIGLTLGVDAWLRARSGRKVGQSRVVAQVSPAVVNATVQAVPLVSAGAARPPNGAKFEPAMAGGDADGHVPSAGRGEPRSGNHVTVPSQADRSHAGRSPGISVSYRATSGGRPGSAPPGPGAGRATPTNGSSSPEEDTTALRPAAGDAVDDSTIILPLSGIAPKPERDDDDSAGGPAESRWR